MSAVVIAGDTSGTITLNAPAVAGTNTLTLPTTSATLLTDSSGVLNIGSGQVYKDASGNVGIGTTSPDFPISVVRGAGVSSYIGTAGNGNTISGNGMVIGQDASGVSRWFQFGANPLTLWTNNVERMRIDSSGNVMIGATSTSSRFLVTSSGDNIVSTVSGGAGANFISNRTSGTGSLFVLYITYNGNLVGSITNTASATAYNTNSDYRLKENIAPMTGALDKVAALKPVTYNWKVDGSDGQGFIAHELQEVVPDAVTGEKDAVETYTDEDGVEQTRPKYQGVDTSFLVATLTAAIQELKAELDNVKAELATLKGAA